MSKKTDYKPEVHRVALKMAAELHALYDRNDWQQNDMMDLYQWFEHMELTGSDLKGFVYKNKLTDEQRAWVDKRKKAGA